MSNECSSISGKITGLFLISKYMIKRYGFDVAVKRVIARQAKKKSR